MTQRYLAAALAAALLAGATSARAETKDEMAFGFGQFVGAASFCKIPREKVNKVAAALLASAEIDSSGPSPEMTRFTAGVTAGVKEMSQPGAASCADVTAAFDGAYEKVGG